MRFYSMLRLFSSWSSWSLFPFFWVDINNRLSSLQIEMLFQRFGAFCQQTACKQHFFPPTCGCTNTYLYSLETARLEVQVKDLEEELRGTKILYQHAHISWPQQQMTVQGTKLAKQPLLNEEILSIIPPTLPPTSHDFSSRQRCWLT